MTVREALAQVRIVRVEGIRASGGDLPPVFRLVADALAQVGGATVEFRATDSAEDLQPTPDDEAPIQELGGEDPEANSAAGVFVVLSLPAGDAAVPPPPPGMAGLGTPGGAGPSGSAHGIPSRLPAEAVYCRLRENGAGILATASPRLLYPFLTHLLRDRGETALGDLQEGRDFPPAFSWVRSTFDFFLTQEGRAQKGLDREAYVRRLAESGFTHLEVNGLADRDGIERGPPGEAYPMFYTYCPALDQFVESDLGAGLYPREHLRSNLEFLKRNAELARKYGLVPGLLCFEPRNVPEEFFDRYPMLRGARVDHPFRSFKPRYNMTIAHPMVLEHYAQMVRRLMEEVPDLGFLSVWTNDSGAGFEHTQSLYVGRNGGPYLIREWKDQEEIARAAGGNALRFLRTLRDAGRETNKDFRVLTRMESFYGEHEVIWEGLEEGLEVETASLATRGWEMPYSHPLYPESRDFPAGSVYQQSLWPEEWRLASRLEARSSNAHFYFAAGPHVLFPPLVGVPYPALTYKRLRLLREGRVSRLAHLGGTHPPSMVPYNVNHEVLRAFQFDPDLDPEALLFWIAKGWAGERFAETLTWAWRMAEGAILAFPNLTALYSTYGFVWYRLWARPLVPDIEAIPLEDRAYYQDFMCTTPHNPNNVDLSRDVLFQLATVEGAQETLERMDAGVWGPLDEAIDNLGAARGDASAHLGPGNVVEDQFVRLSALRCWLTTQRSVAAWIVGVCGFMEAETPEEKDVCRELVREMVDGEVENSRRLLDLLDSDVTFMATTDQGETPLLHGENLRELLEERIALMVTHRDDEPYIDPDYMVRQAGQRA